MNHRGLRCFLLPLLVGLIAILIAFVLVIPISAADVSKDEITAVTLYREKSSCKLRLDISLSRETFASLEGETLSLYELYPYQRTAQITEIDPVMTVTLQKSTFSVVLDFAPESQRLYSKFLLVYEKDDGSSFILTSAHYIDNPDFLAENTEAYPSFSSKKGLQIELLSDAQELGVAHTIIDVAINEYLTDETAEDALSYLYGNKTYYIHQQALDLLDHRIKVLSDAGVHIYLDLVLSTPTAGQSAALDCLYAAELSESARLYGINVYDSTASQYLESFVAFLAKRYTAENGAYGFAGSFLFGYDVNSNRNWNYMGAAALEDYLNVYIAGFRIVDTALRSVYAEGRTYLPLANNFNAARPLIAAASDATLDYSARDFLDLFAAKINAAGAIPWRVAISASASDPEYLDIRTDEYITNDQNTPYLSVENIDVLCTYLSQSPFLYQGTQFPIFIKEFGLSADPTQQEDVIMQAAIYAYAYYKVEFQTQIEAMIYYRHIDHSEDGYRYYGLWTSDADANPDTQKPLYRVFKYIDTSQSTTVTAFALSPLGYASWNLAIPDFSAYKLHRRSLTETTAISEQEAARGGKATVLFDFAGGSLCGFTPSDNTEYIEIREEADGVYRLYASLYHRQPTEYMGVGRHFDEPLNLKANRALSFTLKVDAPASVETVDVMLTLYRNGNGGQKAVLWEGTAQIQPGAWQTLAFQISDFTDVYQSADGIKIWVRSADGLFHEGDFGLWLGSVSVYEKASAGILRAVLLIGLIVVSVVAAFYAFIVVRNLMRARHVRTVRNARTRAEAEARRRQYEQQTRSNRQNTDHPKDPPRHRDR